MFAEVKHRLGLWPVQQRSTLLVGGPNMFSRAYIAQNKKLNEKQVLGTAALCEGTHTGVCYFKTSLDCQTTPQIPALNSLTEQCVNVCVCVFPLPDSCTLKTAHFLWLTLSGILPVSPGMSLLQELISA